MRNSSDNNKFIDDKKKINGLVYEPNADLDNMLKILVQTLEKNYGVLPSNKVCKPTVQGEEKQILMYFPKETVMSNNEASILENFLKKIYENTNAHTQDFKPDNKYQPECSIIIFNEANVGELYQDENSNNLTFDDIWELLNTHQTQVELQLRNTANNKKKVNQEFKQTKNQAPQNFVYYLRLFAQFSPLLSGLNLVVAVAAYFSDKLKGADKHTPVSHSKVTLMPRNKGSNNAPDKQKRDAEQQTQNTHITVNNSI